MRVEKTSWNFTALGLVVKTCCVLQPPTKHEAKQIKIMLATVKGRNPLEWLELGLLDLPKSKVNHFAGGFQ